MPPQAPPQHHPDYPVLKNWAHRRAVVLVRPPAVVQHLGHWIPADLIFKRQSWLAEIDTLIQEIHKQLSTNKECTDYECSELKPFALDTERLRRHYAQRFRFRWRSASVEMSLELHEEFLTISNFISLFDWDDKLDKETHAVAELAKNIRYLNKTMTERYGEITNCENEPTSYDKHIKNLKKDQLSLEHANYVVHKQIWNSFEEDVLGGLFSKGANPERRKHTIGRRFIDIRGLLIHRLWDLEHWNAQEEPKVKFRPKSFIAEPGEASRVLPVFQSKSAPAFSGEESIRCVNTILPYMIAGVDNVEHTFSLVLNGRCIHATALGALPPERMNNGEEPITYLMLSTSSNRWQMGRLIDRIHMLGTLRLAALYDLPRVNVASETLRDIEKDLDPLRNRLPSLVAGDGGKVAAIHAVASELFRISGRLVEIDKRFEGGLLYRMEHFRFYRRQFEDLVSSLRIDQTRRIEGFQPYDKFIKRRLGDVYDFVEMTGIQYSRIQKSMESVNQQLRTVEALEALEQETMQQALTREHIDTIIVLQKGAELGFWMVLFPYYASHVLLGIFDSEKCPRFLLGIRTLPVKYLIETIALGYGLAVGSGLVDSVMKNFRKHIFFAANLVLACAAIVFAGCYSGLLSTEEYGPQRAQECQMQPGQGPAAAERRQEAGGGGKRNVAVEGTTVPLEKNPSEGWINPSKAAAGGSPPAPAPVSPAPAPGPDASGNAPQPPFPEVPPVTPPAPGPGTSSEGIMPSFPFPEIPGITPPATAPAPATAPEAHDSGPHATPEELGFKELVLPPVTGRPHTASGKADPAVAALPGLAPAAGAQKQLLNIVGEKQGKPVPCAHAKKPAGSTTATASATPHRKHGNCYVPKDDIVSFSQ